MFKVVFVGFFLVLITLTRASPTFDLSNLDLVNFQYFKYPDATTQKPIYFERNGHLYSIRRIPDKPNKLQTTVSKTKAVFKYLKGLAIGNEEERIKVKHTIDPNLAAEKLNKPFEEKYGKYGKNLVEFLGNGPSHENLIRAGVI